MNNMFKTGILLSLRNQLKITDEQSLYIYNTMELDTETIPKLFAIGTANRANEYEWQMFLKGFNSTASLVYQFKLKEIREFLNNIKKNDIVMKQVNVWVNPQQKQYVN